MTDKTDATGDSKKTQAQILYDLVMDEVRELFTDEHGTPYASIRVNGHYEVLKIKSGKFRHLIHRINYEQTGKPVGSETLNRVSELLQANARFDGNERTLHIRAYFDEESNIIYIDLTNRTWQIVKITKDGWTIEESENMPIIFKRHNQTTQVEPSRDYPDDIFDQFINLLNVKKEDHKILLKVYIVSLLLAHIPKAVLILYGEQGAAKSTGQELIKDLIDPSSIKTLSIPRDNNELIQQLSHNYIAYYDNLSYMREWTSDQLCRAVTGSGSSKRELYSDDDDVIYQFKRCVGLNGINLAASRADLLDRSIITQFEFIDEKDRETIRRLLVQYKIIKPKLLGYIFNTLVKVMNVISEGGINLNSKSRMADWEEFGEIISRCMGNPKGKFVDIYRENRRLQTETIIEGSPLALMILRLMDDSVYNKLGWEGTATELLRLLEDIAGRERININNKSWPKGPQVLTRRLNEIKTNLRQSDISIEYDKEVKDKTKGNRNRERIINIRIIPSASSYRPQEGNSRSNSSESADDSEGSVSEISSAIPSTKTRQIHAQKQVADDADATDGILHTSIPYDYHELEGARSAFIMGFNDDWVISKLYGDIWKCDYNKCKIDGRDKFYTFWHAFNVHVSAECKEKLGMLRGFDTETQQRELRTFSKHQLDLLLYFVEPDTSLQKEILKARDFLLDGGRL